RRSPISLGPSHLRGGHLPAATRKKPRRTPQRICQLGFFGRQSGGAGNGRGGSPNVSRRQKTRRRPSRADDRKGDGGYLPGREEPLQKSAPRNSSGRQA